MMPPPIIDLRSVSRVYDTGRTQVHALAGVDIQVDPGEFVAVVGPSGSGKSTLMNVIGCLDRPTSGTYHLAGTDVGGLDDDGLAALRSRRIGFVFQSYNLIQQYTVLENIEVPLLYQGRLTSRGRRRCHELAEMVGLGDRLGHRPSQLSGGQQQRVAIARSLVNDPYFILADEATGNLDSVTAEEILLLFRQLNDEGRTIIMVTHEDDVAANAKRIIKLRDGLLQSDLANEHRRTPEPRRPNAQTTDWQAA